MCPVPEKAIILEDVTVTAPTGEAVDVRRPVVVRDRCIGCGICENRCPLNGEAAIRVYTPSDLALKITDGDTNREHSGLSVPSST